MGLPVIVLTISGKWVLMGQSGKWLSEKDKDTEFEKEILSRQIISGENTPEGIAAATRKAESEANELTKRLNIGPIRFTPLVWKNGNHTTRFLYPANSPGFIKGTYPDSEHPGEIPIAAARREFMEETGTDIADLRYRDMVEVAPMSNIFRLVLRDIPLVRSSIIKTWTNLGIEGEVYNLHWARISDVKRAAGKLNNQSRTAVPYLEPIHFGGRTRRTLRKRKTHRQSK